MGALEGSRGTAIGQELTSWIW